jgi:hypothetical protein
VQLQEGFTPTSIADVVRLARELGVVEVIDGEAVEAPKELEAGEGA